jgi:predicted TIM-barrel fold metal-dependent hydrolase
MKKQAWLKRHKKTAPELPLEPPILLGNRSNGEFFHEQTPRERKIRELILQKADENARRLGVDRREFLASSMGMATSLVVLNMVDGCGSKGGATSKAGAVSDGGYAIPPDAMLDQCTADRVLAAKDFFIMDLQTHFIEDEKTWTERHPNDGAWQGDTYAAGLNWALSSANVALQCGGANNLMAMTSAECIGPTSYVNNILLNSDTTVAVLSGFPSAMCSDGTMCTNLNSNDDMAWNRDRFNTAAGGSQRVVQHCQVCPNDQWDKSKAMMAYVHEKYGNHGWKVYPPWAPNGGGWWLDDSLNTTAIAEPFYEQCKLLGQPLVCAHKGFPLPGFDRTHADPVDVGPAAVRHPEINFIIYHSAFEQNIEQGPYGTVLDSSGALQSVDRLCKTVSDNHLKGKNVYAEMGSAWALVYASPVEAQHYIGKLLTYFGEDNICWGSECTWFGSPQPQIEAFRTFTISTAFQQMYGYPELTDAIKAKIFGLTGAKLYGIDPAAKLCSVNAGQLAMVRRHLDGEFGDRRWAFQEMGGPTSRREFMRLQKWRKFLGEPA